MSKISIEPESVKKNLTTFKETYPWFHASLKSLNSSFENLNSYWKGDRYIKTMRAWNKIVPELNKELKSLSEASTALNTILKNYTTVDTNPIAIEAAKVKTLTYCKIDNNKEKIIFEEVKLAMDISKMKNFLSAAKKHAESMKNANTKAKWSDDGGAADSVKKDVNNALGKIIESLSKLSSDIEKSLKDTSTAFGKAQKSYKS